MAKQALSRYLDPDLLNRIADRVFEPRDLVLGSLAGSHRSPLAGFAVEFAGHREYVPGDDPKHIDWRVFFNRDKYFVKQYALETNLVCHLVVDVSTSMQYGSANQQKLYYACQLATLLSYLIVRQSDQVSLCLLDDELREFLPPSNSPAQLVRATQCLQQITPVDKTDLSGPLNDLAARIGRQEIVIIMSDFFTDLDALEDALGRLRYARHEVVLFHLLHADELQFNLRGLTRFVGLETDDELHVEPQDIRNAYLHALVKFQGTLADIAQRHRCELIQVNTQQSIAEVLVDYPQQRSIGREHGRLRH